MAKFREIGKAQGDLFIKIGDASSYLIRAIKGGEYIDLTSEGILGKFRLTDVPLGTGDSIIIDEDISFDAEDPDCDLENGLCKIAFSGASTASFTHGDWYYLEVRINLPTSSPHTVLWQKMEATNASNITFE